MKNKIIVPPALLQFLGEWLEWATSDAPKDGKFKKHLGLCGCYCKWCHQQGKTFDGQSLKAAFLASGLDTSYPFGFNNFNYGVDHDTQHLDPNRLEWVRATIKNCTLAEVDL